MKKNKGILKKIVIILLILLFYYNLNYFFIYGKVVTNTMPDSIKKDAHVIAVKTKEYKRGDTIIFKRKDKLLMRRIIGEPKEKIDIDKNGNIFINGKFLYESYTKSKGGKDLKKEQQYNIPQKEYFVMGDNRDLSVDSRMQEFGTIKKEEILGKILMVINDFNL